MLMIRRDEVANGKGRVTGRLQQRQGNALERDKDAALSSAQFKALYQSGFDGYSTSSQPSTELF
jgi:hypothetical protein